MKNLFMSRDQVKVVDLLDGKSKEYDDKLYDADAATLWEDDFDEYEEFEDWARRQREEKSKKYRIKE